MDVRDGRLYEKADIGNLDPETKKHLIETTLPLSRRQRREMKVKGKDPCPCGSGKKFKRCCRQSKKKIPGFGNHQYDEE